MKLQFAIALGAFTVVSARSHGYSTRKNGNAHREYKAKAYGHREHKTGHRIPHHKSSYIPCDSWVGNSGTICYYENDYEQRCNPSIFTGPEACSVERCCKGKPEKKMWCDSYVDYEDISCENGVNDDKKCALNGSGADKCSKDYCCVTMVRVVTNCYKWTHSGADCASKANGWESVLQNYKCFEWQQQKETPTAYQQNGIGPCSSEQCCAMVKPDPTPVPKPTVIPGPKQCKDYNTNTSNYDWRCDCWAAANNFSCPKGKYVQNGKQCTRYSGLIEGVPKCTDGHCCASTPWVY